MKHNADQILGKTIVGLIIKENKDEFQPSSQLFLLFDDHTSYEFYSDDGHINPTGSLDNMTYDAILHYTDERTRVVFHAMTK
jgi:hypothetical protein